jgi:hypothetical protein
VITVEYDDLSAAFDFVSFAAPLEHRAYVSIDTSTIYWISEVNPLEEEIPEDLETSDRYIAIPHKNDLKELLASEGCLDKWYAFEAESTERALRNWCSENDIIVIGSEGRSA